MKQHHGTKNLLNAVRLIVLVLLAGILFFSGAGAEDSGGKFYADSEGRIFHVVPLGDGRYELWQMIEEKKPETDTAAGECQHKHLEWKENGQVHWQHCLDCDKLFPPEAHIYDEVSVITPATCKKDAVIQRKCRCGKVDEGNTAPAAGDPAEWFAHHTYNDTFRGNNYMHWQNCTVCGAKSEESIHTITNLKAVRESTCIQNATVEFDCSVCQLHFTLEASDFAVERFPELKDFQALGHDFTGAPRCIGSKKVNERDKGSHVATCTRCSKPDYDHPVSHVWSEYTIANGTCEDEKDPVIIGGTCDCGATLELKYTRHHQFVKDSSQDIQPTCTEPGKVDGERCLFCGIFGNYTFAEPLGHHFTEDESKRIEPTCTDFGTSFWECDRIGCTETETRQIAKKSLDGKHHFVRKDISEAKCNGNGWYIMECEICHEDDKKGNYWIDNLPHDLTYTRKEKGKTSGNPTNTPNGWVVGTQYEIIISCRRCGKTLGIEERTVFKSIKENAFKILPGRIKEIPDLKDGVHPSGQFRKDGGVYFQSQIEKALDKDIRESMKKYEVAE